MSKSQVDTVLASLAAAAVSVTNIDVMNLCVRVNGARLVYKGIQDIGL